MLAFSRTFLLGVFTFLVCSFWLITLEFIKTVEEPLGQTLTTIILMGVLMKIIIYLDLGNMLAKTASDWYEAFAYGSINNKITTTIKEDTYRKHIIDEIISDYEKKKNAHKK